MAPTKLRSSCSFPNTLLSCLNLLLFLLASASIAPIILLRSPPTSFGWALLISSLISLVASFLGFLSHFTHFCFMIHISFLFASLASQALSLFTLWAREKSSFLMLDSPRDPREVMVLVRLECGILMVVLLVQFAVLFMACAVHSCWVREFEGLEEEREKMAKKRSQRMAVIREESLANVAKVSEVKAKEFDDKMKNKYGAGLWVKNDFEGY